MPNNISLIMKKSIKNWLYYYIVKTPAFSLMRRTYLYTTEKSGIKNRIIATAIVNLQLQTRCVCHREGYPTGPV